jgi:hypothetical protein
VNIRFFALLIAALPLVSHPTSALAQATPSSGKPHASAPEQQRIPMVFYLAKGEANACGEGCSEWIAADGYIDVGSVQRLRSLLDRYPGRNLPIYFASPGGLLEDALAIGRLLRERGMTAGIANSVPFGCIPATEKNRDGCRALKRSNGEIPTELRSMGASCNSACVYALLGAKVREIPPGAHLGVHSGRLVRVSAVDGRVKAGSQNRSQASQKAKTAEFESQIRSYTQEMGVDPGLIDMALKIPFAQIHYLSRAEIAGYGVDTRGFQETRWTTANTRDAALAVFKILTEARGLDGKELRASVIRLACRTPTQVILAYVRGLASDEVGQSTSIQMSLGDQNVTLPRTGLESKIDAIDAGSTFDTRFISAPIELFEAAAASDSIDITETGPSGGSQPGRVSKLSTAGLRGALNALRQQCGGTQ